MTTISWTVKLTKFEHDLLLSMDVFSLDDVREITSREKASAYVLRDYGLAVVTATQTTNSRGLFDGFKTTARRTPKGDKLVAKFRRGQ